MNSQANIKLDNERLFVSGELNFATVVNLWNASLPLLTKCNEFNFDFSNVTSSNSAGLALLIEWFKQAKQANKNIFFHQIPAQLRSIAVVAGVEKMFISVA